MRTSCILTDNTAQFPQPVYPGRPLVRLMPLDIVITNQTYVNGGDLKVSSFPSRLNDNFMPHLQSRSTEEIHNEILTLEKTCDQILILIHSSLLSPTFDAVKTALQPFVGHTNIALIDSQAIGPGLGLLTQVAADLAEKGASLNDIELALRVQIPHLYSIFCTPNCTYLANSGYLDQAQAKVSEMLGLYGVFTLEEGKLNPVEKVKNHRSVIEIFQEFMDEFEHVRSISLIQSNPPASAESRALRQYAEELFGKTPFSEHVINPWMATLLGPGTLGMVIAESVNLP